MIKQMLLNNLKINVFICFFLQSGYAFHITTYNYKIIPARLKIDRMIPTLHNISTMRIYIIIADRQIKYEFIKDSIFEIV